MDKEEILFFLRTLDNMYWFKTKIFSQAIDYIAAEMLSDEELSVDIVPLL